MTEIWGTHIWSSYFADFADFAIRNPWYPSYVPLMCWGHDWPDCSQERKRYKFLCNNCQNKWQLAHLGYSIAHVFIIEMLRAAFPLNLSHIVESYFSFIDNPKM